MSDPWGPTFASDTTEPFDATDPSEGLFTQLEIPVIFKWARITIIAIILILFPVFVTYGSVEISALQFRTLVKKLDPAAVPVQPIHIFIFIILLFGGYVLHYNLQLENLRKLSESLDNELSLRDTPQYKDILYHTLFAIDRETENIRAEVNEIANTAIAYERERNEAQNSNLTDIDSIEHDSISSKKNDNVVKEFPAKCSNADKPEATCFFISLDDEQAEPKKKPAKKGIFAARKIENKNVTVPLTKGSSKPKKVETPKESIKNEVSEKKVTPLTFPLPKTEKQGFKSSPKPITAKAKSLNNAMDKDVSPVSKPYNSLSKEKTRPEVKNLDTTEKNSKENKITTAKPLSGRPASIRQPPNTSSKFRTSTSDNSDKISEVKNLDATEKNSKENKITTAKPLSGRPASIRQPPNTSSKFRNSTSDNFDKISEVKNLDATEKNSKENKITTAKPLSGRPASVRQPPNTSSKFRTSTPDNSPDNKISEKRFTKNISNLSKNSSNNQTSLTKSTLRKKETSASKIDGNSLKTSKGEVKSLNTPKIQTSSKQNVNSKKVNKTETEDTKQKLVSEKESVLQSSANLVSPDTNISPVKKLNSSEDVIFTALNETYAIDSGVSHLDTFLLPVIDTSADEKVISKISSPTEATQALSCNETYAIDSGVSHLDTFLLPVIDTSSDEKVISKISSPTEALSKKQSSSNLKSSKNDQTEPKKKTRAPLISSSYNKQIMSKQNTSKSLNNSKTTTLKTPSIVKPVTQRKAIEQEVTKKFTKTIPNQKSEPKKCVPPQNQIKKNLKKPPASKAQTSEKSNVGIFTTKNDPSTSLIAFDSEKIKIDKLAREEKPKKGLRIDFDSIGEEELIENISKPSIMTHDSEMNFTVDDMLSFERFEYNNDEIGGVEEITCKAITEENLLDIKNET